MEKIKITKIITSLILILIMGTFQNIFSQDTLDVPPGYQTLDGAIIADVDDNGDPLNLNRVWRLERGGWYLITEALRSAKGSPLRVVAAEGEGHPPIIIPVVLPDVGSAPRFSRPTGDAEYVGLYISGINDLGGTGGKNMFRFEGEGSRYIIDNCFLDHDRQAFIRANAPSQKLYITNSIFRSSATVNNPYEGIMIASRGGYQDTIFVENSTFFVASSRFWHTYGGVMHNVIFNHNTFAQSGSVHTGNFGSGRTINLTVTNNLFMDVSIEGYRNLPADEYEYRDIWPIDSLYADTIATDAERNIYFSNNVYGWSQEVKDYIATRNDTVRLFDFHGPSTLALFAMYDGMSAENNIEESVVFTDPPDINILVDYARDRYDNDKFDNLIDIRADRNGIGELVANPETFGLTDNEFDFSYATSFAAYTHGMNGAPVGDLNWFPDYVVSVKPDNQSAMPSNYSLEQNYPNPFNPTTTINFSIPSKGMVSLKVYNSIGEIVTELVNEELVAGAYTYQFDAASLSSGIYFYSINTDNFSQTKKMLLLK